MQCWNRSKMRLGRLNCKSWNARSPTWYSITGLEDGKAIQYLGAAMVFKYRNRCAIDV